MVDTAVFSFFHRPRPPINQASRELPGEPIVTMSQPQAEPAKEAEALEQPVTLGGATEPDDAAVGEVVEQEPLAQAEEEPLPAAEEYEPLLVTEEAEPLLVTEEAEPLLVTEEAEPLLATEEAEPLLVTEEAEPLLVIEEAEPLLVIEEAEPLFVREDEALSAAEEKNPPPVGGEEAPTLTALEPEGEVPGQEWADLTAISLHGDQLGLANPKVISLLVHLPNSDPIPLAVDRAGIYRPPGFRPAPWSGFAYDQANNALTGIAAGTRILTARGEIEVEKLVPGDAAMALRSAALLPISWIGRSAAAVPSVCIESGALGPNLPRRTVYLGPDQAVFVDPVPVSARELVNGTTIREIDPDRFDLFHVDVGSAEVLFAEGLPLSSSHRASLHIG